MRRMHTITLIFLFATLLQQHLRADNPLGSSFKGKAGVVQIDSNREIAFWVGPESSAPPQPKIDHSKRTLLYLRVVPDGLGVLNKHSSAGNVSGIVADGVDMTKEESLVSALKNAPHLKMLSLRHLSVIDKSELSDMPENENYSATPHAISSEALSSIAALRDLEQLKLAGLHLDTRSINTLATRSSLTVLHIQQCSLPEADLSSLIKLGRLQELNLSGSSVSRKFIDEVLSLGSLRILSMQSTNVDDAFVEKLINSKLKLSYIELFGTNVTSIGMEKLKAAFPFLVVQDKDENLDTLAPPFAASPQQLREYRAAAYTLERFSSLRFFWTANEHNPETRHIRAIEFSSPQPQDGDWTFSYIEMLPGIEGLAIKNLRITNSAIASSTSLRNLKFLRINDTPLSATDMLEIIKHAPRLRTLALTRTGTTGDVFNASKELSSLQTISFEGNAIADGDLLNIAALQELRNVELKDCNISDIGAKELLKMQKLESFDVTGTNVSPAMIKELIGHCKRNSE